MTFTPGLEAGRLNRLIQIQQQTTTQDAFGQQLTQWATFLECRAAIETQNSELLYSTAEFIANATYRITIRFNPQFVIMPNMRVVYTNLADNVTHTYIVKTILNDGQSNRQIVLLVYELNGEE